VNILIPILGKGSRFSIDGGYTLPKPMIRSCGEHLICKLLKSLNITNSDTVYILYREEFDIYNFTETVSHNVDTIENIQFLPFNGNTRGAAESINIGCDFITNEDTVLILDCDTIYECDIISEVRKSKNAIVYTKNYDSKPIYSYIIYNDKKQVLSIQEKEKISNNISVGAYLFRDKATIKKYSELALNAEKNKECYISSIYKEMIKDTKYIDAIYIDSFNCFGTPEQLKKISSNIHCHLENKKRFCFDLDNTLVSYPEKPGDYSTVKPIKNNIKLLRYLHETGHYIIIYTARRMRTWEGDVDKVIDDIGETTKNTLEEFNIPYHELKFGKPYANFYIDDLAINAFEDIEKQTGFYMLHTEPRDHNRLTIYNDSVEKFSDDISGEKHYYQNIPEKIKNFFPRIIKYNNFSIIMEKIDGIPLSYLYTSKNLSENLLKSIFENLKIMHDISPNEDFTCNIYSNYLDKLKNRVSNFDFSAYNNFDYVYNDIVKALEKYENEKLGKSGVIHGDPVFSNILIDYENNSKFIDMRGKVGSSLTIYGDIMYDYAKIYQSIIGYDFVLYDKIIDNKFLEEYKKIFYEYIEHNYGQNYLEYIRSITKSLIISLIPIHNNDKCQKYYELIDNC
jgi:capsule biosynthesis phosphatase